MKVVGIGLNKTGTSTLKTCMKSWGFNHFSFNLDAFNAYRNQDYAYLKRITDAHDSFENWPWALMHRQFNEWYPETKFILTRRKDDQTWFRSLSRHGKSLGPLVEYELYIYGYASPDENKQAHLDFYNRHNNEIRDYYKDRTDKFLEVCWEEGDGWEQLSRFLNLKVPDTEFPHSNKTPSAYRKFVQKYRPILGRYRRALIKKMSNS